MDTIIKQRRSVTPLPRPPEGWEDSARRRSAVFDWILETLLIWQERASQRSDLGQLNDRMLKDIGLSRADVMREVEKPFWRG